MTPVRYVFVMQMGADCLLASATTRKLAPPVRLPALPLLLL